MDDAADVHVLSLLNTEAAQWNQVLCQISGGAQQRASGGSDAGYLLFIPTTTSKGSVQ